MYIEHPCPRHWTLIFVVVFVLLALPDIWIPGLTIPEATNAVTAKEFLATGNYFLPTYFGEPAPSPPLPAWMMTVFWHLLPINEFTVRLINVIALILLTGIGAHISWQVTRNAQSTAVTAAAIMSSVLALKLSGRGDGELFFCLLINASWYSWFYFSREKHQWLLAWFSAHLLVALAILTGGLRALVIFYLPLLFLRRPLTIWRRLRQFDHLFSLSILVGCIMIWLMLIPMQSKALFAFWDQYQLPSTGQAYIKQLALFPLLSTCYYIPWIFLTWPAFCMAFRPMEKTPIISQFLRTIILSFFLIFWFIPELNPEDLTFLIGPLSILVGFNYELLVRRYGKQLLLVPAWLCKLSLTALSTGWIVIIFFRWEKIESTPEIWYFSLLITLLSALLAWILLKQKLSIPIWMLVLLATVACRWGYAGFYHLAVGDHKSQAKIQGVNLSKIVPSENQVFVLTNDTAILSVQGFYLNRPVIKITSPDDLPNYEDTTYVLASERMTQTQQRTWSAISETIESDGRKFRLWKAVNRRIGITPDRVRFSYNPILQKYEISQQSVLLSNRISKPLEITLNGGDAKIFRIINPSSKTLILDKRSRQELTIEINPAFIPDDDITKIITLQFSYNNEILTRQIEITVGPLNR